eukprot:1471705-Rhodomonas_salina.1
MSRSPFVWSKIPTVPVPNSAVYMWVWSGENAYEVANSKPAEPKIGSLRRAEKFKLPEMSSKSKAPMPPTIEALELMWLAKFCTACESEFSRTLIEALDPGGSCLQRSLSTTASWSEGHTHTSSVFSHSTALASWKLGASLTGRTRIEKATAVDVSVPLSASERARSTPGPHDVGPSSLQAAGNTWEPLPGSWNHAEGRIPPSSTARITTRTSPLASGFRENRSAPSGESEGRIWNILASDTSSSTNEMFCD